MSEVSFKMSRHQEIAAIIGSAIVVPVGGKGSDNAMNLTMEQVTPPQVEDSYFVAVTKQADAYVARLDYRGRAGTSVGEDSFAQGIGDTPLEAFYDFCEVVAEWGLNGEHRNWPPHWWQMVWWDLQRAVKGVVTR